MLKWPQLKFLDVCVLVCFLFKYFPRLDVDLVEKQLQDFTTAGQRSETRQPEQRTGLDVDENPNKCWKI